MADIVKLDRNGSIRYIGDSKVRDSITNEFSTSTNYNINDLVMYDGQLYKFTSNHEAGIWDNNEVTQTTVINEIKNIHLEYTASTTDLIDGVSELELGELYFYYEV